MTPPERTSQRQVDGHPVSQLTALARASTIDSGEVVIEQWRHWAQGNPDDAVYLDAHQRRELGISVEGFDPDPGEVLYSFPADYTGATVDTPLGLLTIRPPALERRGVWQVIAAGDDVVFHFEPGPEPAVSAYEAGPVPGAMF